MYERPQTHGRPLIDPRAYSIDPLPAPPPLPFVSRRALQRLRNPAPVPTSCNCCQSSAVKLVEHAAVYGGRSFGDWPYAYLCHDCGAYVGLHPKTDIPLGTLADKPLREARKSCKKPFDALWRGGSMTRTQAYQWLASQMGISAAECHFGLFSVVQCHQARDLCERRQREGHSG